MNKLHKITLSLLMLLGMVVTSCDMDKEPYGTLIENNAIESMNDIQRLRNQMYNILRSRTSGTWITTTDLQMDEFHGLISNGNRNGTISNGLFTASDADLEGFFASCYSGIANANYLIEKANTMKESDEFSDEDKVELDRYAADGYFTRAFLYFYLADHYCQPYNEEDADKPHLGVQIVTKYNPSGDLSSYPARSTLNETFTLIEEDLEKAYKGLKEYEASDNSDVRPMSEYLTSYAVAAMQARVALVKGDYETALAKAEEVINSKVYTLATAENFSEMWLNDNSTEIIFRPVQSVDEVVIGIGQEYLNTIGSETNADYIPTFDILALYDAGDVRFDTYFKVWNLVVEGVTYPAYTFQKYPGNVALRTGQVNNFANMSKPFRLAEQYLIAAEACAAKATPDLAKGTNYLQTLVSNRIEEDYMDEHQGNYTEAAALLKAVKDERKRELLGEGFRFSDLRRWHQGFTRVANHAENPDLNAVIVTIGASLKYAADDYRFIWPIPKTELDSNPNLKGQQNPGY